MKTVFLLLNLGLDETPKEAIFISFYNENETNYT